MTLTNLEFSQIVEPVVQIVEKQSTRIKIPHATGLCILANAGARLVKVYDVGRKEVFEKFPDLSEKIDLALGDSLFIGRLNSMLYSFAQINNIPVFVYKSQNFYTLFEVNPNKVLIYVELDTPDCIARSVSAESGIKIVLASEELELRKKEKNLRRKKRSSKKILKELRNDLSNIEKRKKEQEFVKQQIQVEENNKLLSLYQTIFSSLTLQEKKMKIFKKIKKNLLIVAAQRIVNKTVKVSLQDLLDTVRHKNAEASKRKNRVLSNIRNVFCKMAKLNMLSKACKVLFFFRNISKEMEKAEREINEKEANQKPIVKALLEESFKRDSILKVTNARNKIVEERLKMKHKVHNYVDVDDKENFWFGFRKTSTLLSLFEAYELDKTILTTDYTKLHIDSLQFQLVKKSIFVLSQALNTKHFIRFCNAYAGNFKKDSVGSLMSKLLIGEDYDFTTMVRYVNWFSNVYNNKLNIYLLNNIQKCHEDYCRYQEIIKLTSF